MKKLSKEGIINHPKTPKYLEELGIKGKLTNQNFIELSDSDLSQLEANLQMEKYSYSMNEALFFAKSVLKIDNIEIVNESAGMFRFRLVDKTVLVWNSNHGDKFDLSKDSANIGFDDEGGYRKDFIEVEEYISKLKKK